MDQVGVNAPGSPIKITCVVVCDVRSRCIRDVEERGSVC